jgi:hypothetical protein
VTIPRLLIAGTGLVGLAYGDWYVVVVCTLWIITLQILRPGHLYRTWV